MKITARALDPVIDDRGASCGVASQAADAVYLAFHAANEAEPIMVDLPGIRFGPRSVPVTQTSPAVICEFYAHYDFHSRKGGGVYHNGQVPTDLSAARARDETQALANFDLAIERLQERAAALGEPAAAQADGAALEEENDARLALLACFPVGPADAKAKAVYLLSILDVDSDWMDPIDVRTLNVATPLRSHGRHAPGSIQAPVPATEVACR